MNDHIFFTGDTHFGHRNIIEYTKRPFKHTDEMDEVLIENWNRVVPENGIVYHLGDIFLCEFYKAKGILKRLHGQIHLNIGNHERTVVGTNLEEEFRWLGHYDKIKVPDNDCERGRQAIILFHYPIASFELQHHGAWHCYGHCHSSFNKWQSEHLTQKRMLDVGVDSVAKMLSSESKPENYRPLSYDEVKAYMSKKTGFSKQDHHDSDSRPYKGSPGYIPISDEE